MAKQEKAPQSIKGSIQGEKKPSRAEMKEAKKNDKGQSGKQRQLDVSSHNIAQQLRGGIPSILDLFAPDAFDRSNNEFFKMGRYYVKSMAVTLFPREMEIGWMNGLMQHDGDNDISVHIEPFSQRLAMNELTQMITKIKTQQAMQAGNISLVQELVQAEKDAWDIRQLISSNQSKLWKVTVGTNIFNRDRDSMEETAHALEDSVGANGIHMRAMEGRMDEGFQTSTPLGVNFVSDIYRNIDTWGLSTIFPFTVADLVHDEGYPLAMNYQTGAPIYYDPYDDSLINHNMVIYGSSGAGKSTSIKVQVGRAVLSGERHALLDVEGEYRKLVQHLSGTYVRIGDPEYAINPCDVEVDEEVDEETGKIVRSINLRNKALDLTSIIEVAFNRELTLTEKNVFETCVMEEYAARGITEDADSLYDEDGRIKEMPILSDLYARLKRRAEELKEGDLLSGFPRLLKDGAVNFLDRHSTVELRNVPIIGFDLSLLENQQMKAIGLHLVLNFTWEKFLKKDVHLKKRLVIDEGWQFIDIPMCVEFIERVFRRVRKRTAGITFASQDFARIAENPKSKAIHQNTDTFMFLKHGDTDLAQLQEAFDLSNGEASFLQTAGKGEGIMRAGKTSMAFKMMPLDIEANWCFTTPLREKHAG